MNTSQSTAPTIVITGGGTGGHLYPALAVAEAVRQLRPDWNYRFFGRDSNKERLEVERRGIEFIGLPLAGLRRKLTLSNLKALWLFVSGLGKSILNLRRLNKGVVFGVGGYVSAPAMLAGRLLGWPVTLHEQNTIPGLVNRILARLCDAVFVTFEKTNDYLKGGNIMVSGLPVRPELKQAKNPRPQTAEDTVSVLVIGGSQGARKLVEVTLQAFSMMEKNRIHHQALVQTGEKNFEWAGTLPRSGSCTITPYISNMAEAYNAANIVISRAGSGSLSEIAYWGLPSILVPYPYASENHQRVNAEVFERAGAAVLMDEQSITAERMARKLEHLISDVDLRLEMSRQANALSKRDAAELIANQLIEIVERQL